MNDVMWIIERGSSEDLKDVDQTINKLVNYISKLEDRITELEQQMSLIEHRSDLLDSSEGGCYDYYN